jgi:hypothetical protein
MSNGCTITISKLLLPPFSLQLMELLQQRCQLQ